MAGNTPLLLAAAFLALSGSAQAACPAAKTEAAFSKLTPFCRHQLACDAMRERIPEARRVLMSPTCHAVFRAARLRGIQYYGMSPESYFDGLTSAGVCADHPKLSADANLNQSFETAVSNVFISESCGGGLASGQGKGREGKLCITARNFLFGNSDGMNNVYWSQIQLILHEFGHLVDAIYNEASEGSSVDNQRLIGYRCVFSYGGDGARAYSGPAAGPRP